MRIWRFWWKQSKNDKVVNRIGEEWPISGFSGYAIDSFVAIDVTDNHIDMTVSKICLINKTQD